ncbi:hypothetical protein MLD38_018246 [Melastoma candidum]|nr:hypothetical protein MLD38_018246 [Melastoma candidum]
MRECCNCLSSRKVGVIGVLELRVLRRGAFQKVLDYYLGLGAAVSQYKMLRCVSPSKRAVLQILSGEVVKSYFSTAFETTMHFSSLKEQGKINFQIKINH